MAEKFTDANHNPIIRVKEELDRTLSSGETVTINAKKSKDPDGNELSFKWWQYKEAGSYEGSVNLQNPHTGVAAFVTPQVNKPETIQIILEVKDNGSPALNSYKRMIIKVMP